MRVARGLPRSPAGAPVSGQISMLDYEGHVVAPKAPPGVQRAAKVAGRIDATLLRWAAQNVGVEVPKAQLWLAVNAEVACEPDSPRRRLDALAAEGLVQLGEPSRLGHVLVVRVHPSP